MIDAETLVRDLQGHSDHVQRELLIRAIADTRIEQTSSWEVVNDLARLQAGGVSKVVVDGAICDLAWMERSRSVPMLDLQLLEHEDTTPPALSDTSTDVVAAATRIALVFVGERLRYDFKFRELQTRLEASHRNYLGDTTINSLRAFAELGLRTQQAIHLAQQVLDSPAATSISRYTILHGLWFDTDLPDQSERIIELSNRMLGLGEVDPNLFYWRAWALRSQGKYGEARDSIDEALNRLPSGEINVHQDYVRERELIGTMMMIDGHTASLVDAKLAEAVRRIDQRTDEATRTVSSSLAGLVEVLGLFIALIGFIAGTFFTAFQDLSFGNRVLTLALLVVGSVTFFVLLRLVVRQPSLRLFARTRSSRVTREPL